jgi:aldehyde:ferredoxin oxidoreductase
VNLLRIDLTRRRATTETWDDVLSGGRLLTAELLTREVDPGCDPLDAGNPLVFAAGALAGWGISDAGRLSVGAKSPLTGGIKESNTGGDVGDRLANLGYRGVIVTGALPADVPPMVLVIDGGDADPVRFIPAPDYRGLWLEATAERLKADFGDGYTYLAIGPAGEMLMPSAAICAGPDLFYRIRVSRSPYSGREDRAGSRHRSRQGATEGLPHRCVGGPSICIVLDQRLRNAPGYR